MQNALSNRLARIEASMPDDHTEHRVFRVICRKGEEDAALEKLRKEGHKPDDANTLVILRTIVSAESKPGGIHRDKNHLFRAAG